MSALAAYLLDVLRGIRIAWSSPEFDLARGLIIGIVIGAVLGWVAWCDGERAARLDEEDTDHE